MTTLTIHAGFADLSLEYQSGWHRVNLSLDVENFCMDNAYNGDHADIDLSLEQVIRLRDTLTDIINTWEQTS